MTVKGRKDSEEDGDEELCMKETTVALALGIERRGGTSTFLLATRSTLGTLHPSTRASGLRRGTAIAEECAADARGG